MDQAQWERIEGLLQQALDLEPGGRRAFLERACAGEAELRREVEALLGKEEQARSFIESPAVAYLAEHPIDPPAASLAGQRISHYRVESLIGAGGMGQVYRAQDEALPRAVALKMLPAEFTVDAGRVRRFEQEAFAASKLNHPNIVTIFEIIHAGEAHFIAAEYVEGRTLRQLLTDPVTHKPRRLGAGQVIEIAIQVASALKAAHTAWIIHRDIKPENLMVRGDGLVKVLDFGIAKLGQSDRATGGPGEVGSSTAPRRLSTGESPHHPVTPSLTNAGTIMGTASYMSPEQARGEPLDGRTDLFSLGVVLYEMVTGERLFAGGTRAEAVQAVRREQESLPPSYRFDRVPKGLEQIIRKALRHNREERYASAGEMLDELNGLKRRLENLTSRRIAKSSALALLLVVMLAAIATLASRGEVWDEQILRDGHTAAVQRAAFSPDGRLLVSVGENRQVIVWDFARRERLATFSDDHTGWIVSVAFSPDGKRFATASYDKTVIVWDAVNLRQETVLRGHRDKVVNVAFAPDGKTLISAAIQSEPLDGATVLWRVGSWERLAQIPLTGVEAGSLLFLPGSNRMIYHNDLTPNTWDVATGQPQGNQFDPAWSSNNVALSPDGALLVGVTSVGEVIFADFKRRRTLDRFKAHQDNGRAVALSPDGRLVVTGAENLILWDAATRRKITTIDYPSIIWSAAFSPDGRWLVTTHGDGGIRVWDVAERQRAIGFNEHNGPVRTIAWAHDGKRFASAGDDRSVMIWNAESGRREMLLSGHPTRVVGLAFEPDGDTLASVDRDGMVIVWDLAQRRERRRFKNPKNPTAAANCIAMSPDGRVIATSHGVYESATGRQVADFCATDWGGPSATYGMAFSADGTRLAPASSNGRSSVIETATWSLSEKVNFSPRQFISVSFAPDGRQLVTGEDGGTVQLWTTQPLRPTEVIGRHPARIKSVAFSPDGRQVVSAGDDKMIALWDVGSLRLVTRIGLHTSPVYAVAFSPDGRRLVSGEHDHSVRLYTRHRTLWGFRLE